jgi:uncharacterized protein (TIGR00661 family)
LIFVTVGNRPEGFERLLKKIDECAKNGVICDVFVQTGYSNYNPTYCSHTKFVGFNEFQHLVEKSDIIITHGGAGSILTALSFKKPIITVPRLGKYGEIINDHQLQLIGILEREGKIIAVYDIEDLEKAIEKAKSFRPEKANRGSNITELIESYLTETGLIS